MSAFLLESGRITEEQVDLALRHQQTHGGYVGEALVSLGYVRREDVDWALASQLDLPFIFPDADSVDPEAAALASPAWALAHEAVPILRAGGTLTVVTAEPLDAAVLAELRSKTGMEIAQALASSSRIRELIHALYGGDGSAQRARPLSLDQVLDEALARGADRIGVAVRGSTAVAWYSEKALRTRYALEPGWRETLEARVDPSPLQPPQDEAGVSRFAATLHHGGSRTAVEACVIHAVGGTEVLLRPRDGAAGSSFVNASESLRADLRVLAASGAAKVAVRGAEGCGERTVARLPVLALGSDARVAHVGEGPAQAGVCNVPLDSDDPAALLGMFAFDAVTVELRLSDPRLPAILAAAPLCFVCVPLDADADALSRAGIDWLLTASGDQEGPAWELRPLER